MLLISEGRQSGIVSRDAWCWSPLQVAGCMWCSSMDESFGVWPKLREGN
jgi:hypothetical protein